MSFKIVMLPLQTESLPELGQGAAKQFDIVVSENRCPPDAIVDADGQPAGIEADQAAYTMSPAGPSRHFAAAQQLGRIWE